MRQERYPHTVLVLFGPCQATPLSPSPQDMMQAVRCLSPACSTASPIAHVVAFRSKQQQPLVDWPAEAVSGCTRKEPKRPHNTNPSCVEKYTGLSRTTNTIGDVSLRGLTRTICAYIRRSLFAWQYTSCGGMPSRYLIHKQHDYPLSPDPVG